MIPLMHVPEGLREIEAFYGRAFSVQGNQIVMDDAWVKDNLKVFDVGFPLRASWDSHEVQRFVAHKKVGAAMVDALQEIKEFYGLSFMRKHGLDLWGGVYNPRFKRGTKEPSVHAWAIAIDVCPDLGPIGERTRMPWPIVDAFLKRGFENLPGTDGQHFQAVRGY
jgi:hypothetical protein